jgi:hypothetical protein
LLAIGDIASHKDRFVSRFIEPIFIVCSLRAARTKFGPPLASSRRSQPMPPEAPVMKMTCS